MLCPRMRQCIALNASFFNTDRIVPACRRAAQQAIFYVQHELESAGDSHNPAIVLCDRGTVDGLAYRPGPAEEFWSSEATTLDEELGRYHAVIHLRTRQWNTATITRIRSALSHQPGPPKSMRA